MVRILLLWPILFCLTASAALACPAGKDWYVHVGQTDRKNAQYHKPETAFTIPTTPIKCRVGKVEALSLPVDEMGPAYQNQKLSVSCVFESGDTIRLDGELGIGGPKGNKDREYARWLYLTPKGAEEELIVEIGCFKTQ